MAAEKPAGLLPLEGLALPLMDWYDRHVRPLPWREDPTPYRVWVSGDHAAADPD